jgi:hypothetical protein
MIGRVELTANEYFLGAAALLPLLALPPDATTAAYEIGYGVLGQPQFPFGMRWGENIVSHS